MTLKRRAFFLTGASGAGKSALLQSVISYAWPDDICIHIPRKVTTRQLRSPVEVRELIPVTGKHFQELLTSDQLLTHYESYGHWYGLPALELTSCLATYIAVQALPSEPSLVVRREHPDFDVKICLLKVGISELESRLVNRLEGLNDGSFLNRKADSTRDRSRSADFILDANGNKESVFSAFRNFVLSTLGCSNDAFK